MKQFSLKTKLTLLYSIIMTAVVCFVLAILFSFSNKEILTGIESQLEERIADAISNIAYEDDALEVDSDFLELENGIYLSLYRTDQTFLYGKIPYGFDPQLPFEDGKFRKITSQDVQFYVMDMIYDIPQYGTVVIRGVCATSAAEKSFLTTIRFSIIMLPAIVILTAILGYFMTKRTLKPVDHITMTVKTIRKDGNLSHRIGLGKGNDEIYRLASTFDDMLSTLEDSMKREQQFTSDVAHELRTPLSTMTLLCDHILMDHHLDDETKEDVLLLQKKIHSLSKMVSQLLMLSRADQGRAKLDLDEISISDLAVLCCEEAVELAKEKHITVSSSIEDDLTLIGDETLLIRFFMNLLTNAVTYGKENGHIWVSLKQSSSNPDMIIGKVKDDGIGICEKDLPHIWERFYQADSSRTERNNSGLGLSMVEWIVKAHNGTIDVTSKVGEGTTFTFSFPSQKTRRV